jgi:signal transduction histidine kinase
VLRWSPSALAIEVRNDGVARRLPDGRPGRGLTGMRERAGLLGGTVRAERVGQDRFVVEALIPVEGAPR